MHLPFSFGFCLVLAALSSAMALDGSYTIETATSNGLAVGINKYLPPGYGSPENATKRYPLWVFLGGAGEHGNPDSVGTVLNRSTRWGPAREIRYSNRDYPFIVVTPVAEPQWAGMPHQLNDMVEFMKANFRVDADRIIFSGLCTGAGGVMEYAQLHNSQLASIFPVITQSAPWKPSRLVEVPAWMFHAYGDPSVGLSHTITWVNAIANASAPTSSCMANYPYGYTPGGSQRFNPLDQSGVFRPASGWTWTTGILPPSDSLLHFTIYSSDNHEVWQSTVNNPTVLHWAFKQRRQSPFTGSPTMLPGRVQAEHFDFGGHGRAYADRTVANTGLDPYRMVANPFDGGGDDEQVDLASGGDGVVLTGTEAGEWGEFTTVCVDSGTYALQLRVSAPTAGGSLSITANGVPITGTIAIPATEGFTTLTIPGVILDPGPQVLRLVIGQGGFDLDWFEIGPPPGLADLIVDNRQTDKVSISGPWTLSSFTPGFYAADYLSAAPGATAIASFRPLLPRGAYYEVFTQYPANPSRGLATITIDRGNGAAAFTTQVDQRHGGGAWQSLGVFEFPAGSLGSVTISSAGASGYVSADAVRFLERDAPPTIDLIVDNLDGARVTTSGPWALTSFTPGFYAANYLSTAAGSDCVATFRPNLIRDGYYEVSIQYPANGSRGISPVSIAYEDGSSVFTTAVDQRLNGGSWFSLGTFPFNAGPASAVSIRSLGANGYVSADAVRFRQVPALPPIDLVVDNHDASRVTVLGGWSVTTSAPGYFGANYVSTSPASDKQVVYRPNLPRDGTYNIFMWYPATANRGTTPVTIRYEDGGQTSTINVDQRFNGGRWNLLGTFPLAAGNSPSVTIGSFASGGWIGADALRFEETTLVTTN